MIGSLSSKGLAGSFASSVVPKPKKKKRTPPISIRFSDAEREILRQRAGGERLSSYVRRSALAGDVSAHRIMRKLPIKDHAALARVLSALGHSDLPKVLHAIVALSDDGKLVFNDTIQDALWAACADIADMRIDLVAALGLRNKVDP